jgi:hypothetical protein
MATRYVHLREGSDRCPVGRGVVDALVVRRAARRLLRVLERDGRKQVTVAELARLAGP